MDTPSGKVETPDWKRARYEMFREICRGDEAAISLCWSLYQFLHVLDDLVDRDVPVTPEMVGLSFLSCVETFAANPFFQQHRDLILGALRPAVIQWVNSEEWRKRDDVREKVAAEVIKSGYQDVFYLIAGLVGGLPHQLEVAARWREYDWT
jgi:hypothetical protein